MDIKKRIKLLARTLGIQKYIMSIKEKFFLENESNEMIEKRLNFYKNLISDQDLVFDVGANLGNRTEIFLRLGAKVIAVEPNSMLTKKLKKKYQNKIIVENIGLGNENGVEFLNIASMSTISSFSESYIESVKTNRFSEFTWGNKMLCQIKTLDTLIAEYGVPQFIKIDVEGFEAEVLKGLSNKINYISLEYNVPDCIDILNDCVNEIERIDSQAMFNYSVADTAALNLQTWINSLDFKRMISTKEFTDSSWGDIYVKMADI